MTFAGGGLIRASGARCSAMLYRKVSPRCNKTSSALFLFLFLPTVVSLSVAGIFPPTGFAQKRVPASTQNDDLDERIRRVENGLLPPIIIKVEPIAAMLAPQVGGWGLGFELQGENASARFAHSGSNAGYRCLPVAYASKGQGA